MLLDAGDNFINIRIYYTYIENDYGKKVAVIDDKKAEEMLEKEGEKEKIHILETKWKQLSWKEQNTIMNKSTQITDAATGQFNFNLYGYQDSRVKSCLKEWNLKDDKGTIVQVTPENIDRLPADIVSVLLEKYESAVSISKEEEKK